MNKIVTFVILLTVTIAESVFLNPCLNIPNNNFVNDFTSCEGYFLCINNEALPNTCPPGFYFNERDQNCDLPSNVDCIACSSNELEFLQKPDSCTKFVVCLDGIGYSLECPDGLYFDPTINSCNFANLVDCQTPPQPVLCPPTGIHVLPSPESCSRYYVCLNGVPNPKECAPGLHWNQAALNCDLPENANCNIDHEIIEIECSPEGVYFVPHPTNCEIFFVCANGVSIISECAPGLLFDSITLQCNFPDYAICA